jgi:hypothetical protein
MTMHLLAPCILALVAAIVPAGQAAACTPSIGRDGKPVPLTKPIKGIMPRATVVVEGYVELSPRSRKAALPVARVIPRKYIKGRRLPSYALNYYPTSCHVQFPTDRRFRQIVSMETYGAGYIIVGAHRLK